MGGVAAWGCWGMCGMDEPLLNTRNNPVESAVSVVELRHPQGRS